MSVSTLNIQATASARRLPPEEEIAELETMWGVELPSSPPNPPADLSTYDLIGQSVGPVTAVFGATEPTIWADLNAAVTKASDALITAFASYAGKDASYVQWVIDQRDLGNYGTLDTHFKTQWVHALRTQPERQIHHRMRDGIGGVCALGLAEEIIDITGPSLATVGITGALPDIVILMNDMEKLSFPQIADWVEAHL